MKKLLTAVFLVLFVSTSTASAQTTDGSTLQNLFSQVRSIADVIASLTQSSTQVAQVSGATSFTPTYKSITAEEYPVGTTYTQNMPDDEYTNFNYTKAQPLIVTDAYAANGSKSYEAKMNPADNRAGAQVWLPKSGAAPGQIRNVLLDGKTMQLQFKVLFPTGFDFSSSDWSGVKFIRIPRELAGQGTFKDFKIMSDGSGSFASTQLRRGDSWWQSPPGNFPIGPKPVFAPDTWHTVTMEIKWSTQPGVARERLWVSNVPGKGSGSTLIYDSFNDSVQVANLKTAQDVGSSILIVDHWNNDGKTYPTKSQSFFLDDFYYTDENNPIPFSGGVPVIVGGLNATTPPQTTQSTQCTYTYNTVGSCQPNGTQAVTVKSSSPSGCTGTPATTQSCTYITTASDPTTATEEDTTTEEENTEEPVTEPDTTPTEEDTTTEEPTTEEEPTEVEAEETATPTTEPEEESTEEEPEPATEAEEEDTPTSEDENNEPTYETPTLKPNHHFTRSLKEGDKGEDVRQLQKFLNQKGFTVSSSGEGSLGQETTYFGPATKKALIRYQNAHKEAILTPVDLEEGTGYFGPSTIEHINEAEPSTSPNNLSTEERAAIMSQIAELLILIQQLQEQLEAMEN